MSKIKWFIGGDFAFNRTKSIYLYCRSEHAIFRIARFNKIESAYVFAREFGLSLQDSDGQTINLEDELYDELKQSDELNDE